MDSMQVYRGLDVGTAKPNAEERSAVVHHLLDVAGPEEEWSVARFQEAARAAVAEIESRGRRALLVGGTGLYVQAVLDDLRFPGERPDLRAEIESRVAEPEGLAGAYAELQRRDPRAAARIDPHNARRIVRALEVLDLTGEPFSSFGPGLDTFGRTVFPVRMVGVWLPRAVLGARIEERVAQMRAEGFVEEVRGLLAGPGMSRTARQAIGYRELIGWVEAGGGPLDGVFESIVGRTRAFARRQRMWFRRDPRVTWLGAARNPCDVAPALLAWWGR